VASNDVQNASSGQADRRAGCEQPNKDGTSCKGTVRPGSHFCFAHDPALAEQRQQSRRKGGKARSRPAKVLPPDKENLPCDTIADIKALLGLTVNQVRRGELDVKVGSCLGYLSGLLLKATEAGDLEQQVAELRAQLEEVRRGTGNLATANGQARRGIDGHDRSGHAPSSGTGGGVTPLQ
jgi:hypothetical protein